MINFINELLDKNFKAIQPYLQKNKIEAYRILHNTNPKLPIVVDIYKDNAVIYLFEILDEETQKSLEESLKNFGIESFFYKNKTKKDLQLGKIATKEITINEYGNKFSINLSDYLDTGIFLDHRETRKWIGSQSKGKNVLNTFAYTGAFSIYAAQGGAKLTHSVDLSKPYCEWSKKNFGLNNMDLKNHWILKMDTFEYFKYTKRKNLSFDIIIIDPPTFSHNKKSSFSVQKDHPKLINEALEILSPNGFILFSSNFLNFSLNKTQLNQCKVEEKQGTIAADFSEAIPHQSYLIKNP